MTNKVSEEVRNILEEFQIPIYDERKQKGIVRTIVTRAGFESGEVQVVLITTQKEMPRKN